jgi:NAD(P)-dependent dehydrogenase (short-subunit alcohol dehydrogenase family)
MELRGKTAWVVGASGTLGQQISLDLAGAGATVYASGRDAQKLQAIAAAAEREHKAKLKPLPVDITDRASVDAAAAAIVGESGRLDILVNTTSVSLFGDFLDLDDETWLKVLQTKQLGYMRTARAVLPQMRKQKSGVIVNGTGKGGRAPRDVHLPGCSANAALNLLTKGLAMTYGKDGIRVVAVSPGVIDSPRLAAIRNSTNTRNQLDQAASDKAIQGSNYLGRLGSAKEVSNAVLFAASDRAGFTTGTVIEVDGG